MPKRATARVLASEAFTNKGGDRMSPDPVWIDGSTPLNSVNMTKLQTRDEKGAPSGYVALDSAGNITTKYVSAYGAGGGSAGFIAAQNGDGGARVQFSNDGKVSWGSGAGAVDTSLYRSAAGTLKTDGVFTAGSVVYANNAAAATAQVWVGQYGGNVPYAGLTFGGDTYLWRTGIGGLRADGAFDVGGQLWMFSNTAKLLFGSGGDTNLYREGGVLATDNVLRLKGPGTIQFGAGADTSLYRAAADSLKTDGVLYVGKALVVDAVGAGYKLLFGSAQDTNLYRYAANVLKTDGILNAVGGLQINGVPVGGGEIAHIVQSGSVTSGAGVPVVDSGSIAYDGSAVLIEYGCAWIGNVAAAFQVRLDLYDGGTFVALLTRMSLQDATDFWPVLTRMKITPSAGAHNYRILATTESGTSPVLSAPGYMRIARA